MGADLRPHRELPLGGTIPRKARKGTGHLSGAGVGFCARLSPFPSLSGASAALGRTELYPGDVGLGVGEGGSGGTDALLRVPEEVARGYGGRLGGSKRGQSRDPDLHR